MLVTISKDVLACGCAAARILHPACWEGDALHWQRAAGDAYLWHPKLISQVAARRKQPWSRCALRDVWESRKVMPCRQPQRHDSAHACGLSDSYEIFGQLKRLGFGEG